MDARLCSLVIQSLTRVPVQAMWTVARWYTQFGLMAGTVFREVLRDLQVEGLDEEAALVRGISRKSLFFFSNFPGFSAWMRRKQLL
jgi:hypothetical protein